MWDRHCRTIWRYQRKLWPPAHPHPVGVTFVWQSFFGFSRIYG